MEKSRLKQILDVMLMCDVPIGALFGSMNLIKCIINYECKEKLKENKLILKEEIEVVRDIYRKIDLSKLDEETGKSIVQECKPLIEEFCNEYLNLFDNYIEKDIKPTTVPKNLSEILIKINKLSHEFGALNSYKIYEESRGKYFKSFSRSRAQWFVEGKPVEIHPEKLDWLLTEWEKDN